MDDVSGSRRVSVDGTGEVRVAPTAASVSVGVEVTEATLPAAREGATRQAAAMIAAVKQRGVPAADIQTGQFSVAVLRDHDKKGDPTRVKGYQVRNSVDVVVRDLNLLGGVLDDALGSGANQVSGPNFFVEKPEAHEDEARTAAVQDARRKAETLAAAAGAGLGRVLVLDEGAVSRPRPRMMAAKAAMADAATPIEAGSETISVSVRGTWELV